MEINEQTATTCILIVEDNPDHMQIMCDILEELGYHLQSATHGEAAIQIFQLQKPDLILLDARMPVMDGFETCKCIRALSGGDRVPIIFMSGLENESSFEQAMDAGATEYMLKPINWPKMKEYISKFLE